MAPGDFLIEGWLPECSPYLGGIVVSLFYLVAMDTPDSLIPWPSPSLCHPCLLAVFPLLGPELLLGKLEICRPESLQVLSCYQLSQFSSALTHPHTGSFQSNPITQYGPNPTPRGPHLPLWWGYYISAVPSTLTSLSDQSLFTEGVYLSVLRIHSSPNLSILTLPAFLPP